MLPNLGAFLVSIFPTIILIIQIQDKGIITKVPRVDA